MTQIRHETRLDCEPDRTWELVQKPELLTHVTAPLLRFEPVDPPVWPEQWREAHYVVNMKAFGLIPLGRQTITISHPKTHPDAPDKARIIRDDGSGDLMNTWDHWIFIAPHPLGGTRYIDQIEVKAGWLTPFAAAFASLFYLWRQRRWRNLIKRGAEF